MEPRIFWRLYILAWLFVIGFLAFGEARAQQLDPMVDYRFNGVVRRDDEGRIARSNAVIAAFRKRWPCPVTGSTVGPCRGWAIDHIIPLDCGGVDAVYNMQWLPNEIKSARGPFSKDHFERRIYGGKRISAGCP